jgi:glycosyltransferase involved in cell wall biosynthesis
VLRIINRFNLGGITYNVSYLSRFLPEEYETLLIGGPEEEGEQNSLFIPESMGLRPKIIHELQRSINPLNDYFAYRKIKKIIREYKPDIVHTHASKAGAIGRLAAYHCRVPVIVHTFHGHVFEGYFGKIKTSFFKALERYLAKKSHAIIAISDTQKKQLAHIHKICEPSKIHVIPLGFNLDRFTEDLPSKRKEFRGKYELEEKTIAIGIIGRLAPIKNHYLFIDAITYIANNTSQPVCAFIIGDGEMRQVLQKYAQEKQLLQSPTEKNKPVPLIFTSWIKEVDVALAGLDVVALTSINEGTPVSIIEAQAAGKFIVSTNVGGIQDILHPGCGILSENGNASAFKNNLLMAVKHYHEAAKTTTAGREMVLKMFSYQRLCNNMSALYKTLLKSQV